MELSERRLNSDKTIPADSPFHFPEPIRIRSSYCDPEKRTTSLREDRSARRIFAGRRLCQKASFNHTGHFLSFNENSPSIAFGFHSVVRPNPSNECVRIKKKLAQKKRIGSFGA
ncbi:hypothetical protein TNIN_63311 [Trichonephila inaurata madagascariensis]|uniref:Uncharacterized protein n=1 Tax=Trichonephila inaurata madagascariensis TaxID=2747483 RepID=A0A8X6X4Z5_9ARAC|nr:hypothetical protein TNIN_63311 [Trichonephila inaurata madagascariensis]